MWSLRSDARQDALEPCGTIRLSFLELRWYYSTILLEHPDLIGLVTVCEIYSLYRIVFDSFCKAASLD
jgi:hypothetical protein